MRVQKCISNDKTIGWVIAEQYLIFKNQKALAGIRLGSRFIGDGIESIDISLSPADEATMNDYLSSPTVRKDDLDEFIEEFIEKYS